MMEIAVPPKARDARGRDLARIHVLKKDLGLDDDQYRTMLWVVGRVESAKDLDSHGRSQVIAHLQAHAKRPQAAYPNRPNNIDAKGRREMKAIEALLTDAGRPWAYAAAMAKRMFRKERLEFCSQDELAAILTGLHRQAVKRLQAELQALFADSWNDYAGSIASLGFGFDSQRRDIGKYPQAMSEVLRWWRGELPAVCAWPTNLAQPGCCTWCRQRAGEVQHG